MAQREPSEAGTGHDQSDLLVFGSSFTRWSYRLSCVRQCYHAAAAACPTPNRTTNSFLRRLRLPPATATTVPGGYRVWPPGRQAEEDSSVVGYVCRRYSWTVGCRGGTYRPSTTGRTWERASRERWQCRPPATRPPSARTSRPRPPTKRAHTPVTQSITCL